jgi:hypothetical protein
LRLQLGHNLGALIDGLSALKLACEELRCEPSLQFALRAAALTYKQSLLADSRPSLVDVRAMCASDPMGASRCRGLVQLLEKSHPEHSQFLAKLDVGRLQRVSNVDLRQTRLWLAKLCTTVNQLAALLSSDVQAGPTCGFTATMGPFHATAVQQCKAAELGLLEARVSVRALLEHYGGSPREPGRPSSYERDVLGLFLDFVHAYHEAQGLTVAWDLTDSR